MTSTTRTQRRYDHRLREMVCNSKNIDAAVECGVPVCTDGLKGAPVFGQTVVPGGVVLATDP